MNEYTIYALKTDHYDAEANQYWKPKLFESLQNGVARFGWSYFQGSDLRTIRQKIEQSSWTSLNDDEKESWGATFLLGIKEGDYLVYINMPEWGKCTLVRVNAPYYWGWEETPEPIQPDYNHRLGSERSSIRTFGRNDQIVHPSLAARLKLQGRYWRISAEMEFEELLNGLEGNQAGQIRTLESTRKLLELGLRPLLEEAVRQIHHTYPNKALEDLVAETLKNIPGISNVQQMRGRQDVGADITFDFDFGLPMDGFRSAGTCAAQVKSYEGAMGYTRAVEDINRAFEHYPRCTTGLIVSTALNMTEDFERALNQLKEKWQKPVSVLLGEELAFFFLRYGYRKE